MEEITGEKISTDFLFLADRLPEDKRREFFDYRKYILNFPGLNLAGFHIGYFDQNIKIADMIPKDKIVIDVGCGFGFQHILFQNHVAWLGIQEFLSFNANQGEPELKIFTNNAKIINGNFVKIITPMAFFIEKNPDSYFGVANHSLWHDKIRNADDIKLFKELFPNNYYISNENSIIKYDT